MRHDRRTGGVTRTCHLSVQQSHSSARQILHWLASLGGYIHAIRLLFNESFLGLTT